MNAALLANALAVALVVGLLVRVEHVPATHIAPPGCAQSVTSTRPLLGDPDFAGRVRHDTTKPVPPRAQIIRAWQQRQDAIKSFRFAWVESQCHARGWMPNPRYPEREWLAIPALLVDRSYSVTKTLVVDGHRMRFSFDLDRSQEPDGVEVVSPQGDNRGLGVRRHYSYVSVFDGQRGEARLSSLMGSPPATIRRSSDNVDAQDLDKRAILLAFRPLDSVMGDLLLDRAVTNERRTFYHRRSTFLLEERHDPSGWKTTLWLEPERDFIVTRFAMEFEQKLVVDMDIDYQQDPRWRWIPSGWRVTEMLADGSKRLISAATVSSYGINVPIGADQFR